MMPTVAAWAVTRHRIMVWDSFWLPCGGVCEVGRGEVVSISSQKRLCLQTHPSPPHPGSRCETRSSQQPARPLWPRRLCVCVRRRSGCVGKKKGGFRRAGGHTQSTPHPPLVFQLTNQHPRVALAVGIGNDAVVRVVVDGRGGRHCVGVRVFDEKSSVRSLFSLFSRASLFQSHTTGTVWGGGRGEGGVRETLGLRI